jgi:sugar O-acyltransferase (sialic acid O-acetyltransferase NeuD family)
MDQIVIIGAANDGELVVDLIEDINDAKPSFQILGYLDDDPKKHGATINGYPVLGPIAYYRDLPASTKYVVTLASAKRTYRTKQIVNRLGLQPERVVTLIHPQATVSRSASIGAGCIVLAGVRINSRVRLGNCVLVEGNVWLGVGTEVHDYAVVTHDASISGDCVLEEGCYLGANCSVIGKTTIGRWAVVGMGTVVLRNVPTRNIMVGNPARLVGTVDITNDSDR